MSAWSLRKFSPLGPLVLAFALALGACAGTATQESTGEYLDDSAITAKINAKLIADPKVSYFAIKVQTWKGHVILSGFVDNEEERERAIALAKEVPGVKEIKGAIFLKTEL